MGLFGDIGRKLGIKADTRVDPALERRLRERQLVDPKGQVLIGQPAIKRIRKPVVSQQELERGRQAVARQVALQDQENRKKQQQRRQKTEKILSQTFRTIDKTPQQQLTKIGKQIPVDLSRFMLRTGLELTPEVQERRMAGQRSEIPIPKEVTDIFPSYGSEPITPLGEGPVQRGAATFGQRLGLDPERSEALGFASSLGVGALIENPFGFGVTQPAKKTVKSLSKKLLPRLEKVDFVSKKGFRVIADDVKLTPKERRAFNTMIAKLPERIPTSQIKESIEQLRLPPTKEIPTKKPPAFLDPGTPRPPQKTMREMFEEVGDKRPPKIVQRTFKTKKFEPTESQERVLQEAFEKSGVQMRKVRRQGDVIQDAAKLDPKEIIARKPKQLTDAEVVSLTRHISDLSERVAGIQDVVGEGKAKTWLWDDLTDQINAAVAIQSTAGTRSGQTSAAFRIVASQTLDPAYWLRQAKRQLGQQELSERHILKINEFINKGDRDNLAQFVTNLGKVSWLEKLVIWCKVGLLTSPTTDIKNIVSNTTFKLINDSIDVSITRPLDEVVSLFTKKKSTSINLFNVLRSWGSFAKGAKEGVEFMRTGVDNSLFRGNKIEYRDAFDRFSESRTERFLAGYTDLLFRRLEAEDKPFKAMAYTKSVIDQAKTQARNNKLKGVDREEFMQRVMNNPPEDIHNQAVLEARNMTFQAENILNNGWQAIMRGADNVQELAVSKTKGMGRVRERIALEVGALPKFVLEMVNPFNRVATNLFLKGMRFSPLGMVNVAGQIFMKNQGKAVKATADSLVGSAIIAGLWKWAHDDDDVEVRLRNQLSFKERQLLQRSGEQVYDAMKIGDWSVSMSGIDPLPHFLLSSGLLEKLAKKEITPREAILEYMESGVDDLYFGSLKDIIAVARADDRMDYILKSQASSFIPNIVNATSKAFDNTVRAYDTVGEAIMSRIPVVRKRLPAKLDVYGNEIKYNKDPLLNTFNQLFSPLKISKIEMSFVDKELQKLHTQIKKEMPHEKADNVLPFDTFKQGEYAVKTELAGAPPLNQMQVNTIAKIKGENIFKGYTKLFRSKAYRKANTEDKANMVKAVYYDGLNEARHRVGKGYVLSSDLPETAKLDFLFRNVRRTKDKKGKTIYSDADNKRLTDYYRANQSKIDLRQLDNSHSSIILSFLTPEEIRRSSAKDYVKLEALLRMDARQGRQYYAENPNINIEKMTKTAQRKL